MLRWLPLVLVLLASAAQAQPGVFVDGAVRSDHVLALELARPADPAPDWPSVRDVRVYERTSPDIAMVLESVELDAARRTLLVRTRAALSPAQDYVAVVHDVPVQGRVVETARVTVSRGVLAAVVSIVVGAALIQNFVFSRYLGLCIFFGTSGRRETAVGMGVSFTVVMTLSAGIIWALYHFALKPLHLEFLQVLTFVGVIAIFVQLLDTILRKVHPYLFKKLGVYLVLITTNCIVLAVPLILVDNAYDLWESLALAFGSGLGFAVALFLMASVRERLELADVPDCFKGLPIAFVTAGLFALAFLGFSGMSF
jgi:electron transport complex protein RnfA